jgi:predicted aspartyl protease
MYARSIFSVRTYLALITPLLVAGMISRSSLAQEPQKATSPADKQASTPHRRTTVPVEITKQGYILVRVRINGSEDATFLISTSANVNTVSDALVKKLNLSPRPARSSLGTPVRLGDREVQAVLLSTVRLGTFRFEDQGWIVLSGTDLEGIVKQPVDGVLGNAFLLENALYFDPARREVTLLSPAPRTREDLAALNMADATLIPIDAELKCLVRLSNGDRTTQARLVLDTGSTQTIFSQQAIKALDLKTTEPEQSYFTPQGTAPIGTYTVPQLILSGPQGDVSIPNAHVRGFTKETDITQPMLGMDFFSRFRVLVDYPGRKMYLKAVEASPAPSSK